MADPSSPPLPLVRPPWPDELPRLADAFPGLTFPPPVHLRVLVVPATSNSPERIVGVAALTGPAEGRSDGALRFAVRPRQTATSGAGELLDAILGVAREQALSAVVTPAPITATGQPAAWLTGAGFGPATEAGFWQLTLKR